MSFIQLEDAATATVLALGTEGPAIYNVTDDEPAPMRDWLPALAAALGAKPPYRAPGWAGRLLMGKTLTMMTEARGHRTRRQGRNSAGPCVTRAGAPASPPPTAANPAFLVIGLLSDVVGLLSSVHHV
jgi:nucleoside-diphosphate-sugar epimerase